MNSVFALHAVKSQRKPHIEVCRNTVAESHIRLAGCTNELQGRKIGTYMRFKYKNYLKGIVKKPQGKAKINLDKCTEDSEDRDITVWNKC